MIEEDEVTVPIARREGFTLRFERVRLNKLKVGEKFTHIPRNGHYWSPYLFEQIREHEFTSTCDFDVYRVTEIDEKGGGE